MPRPKKERNLWRGYEIEALLDIIHEHNIVDSIRHKKHRSEQIYRFIQNQMAAKGFTKKNYRQIWTKWKCLKSLYVTTRRRNSIPGNKFKKCEYYDLLDRILGNVPEVLEATTFFGNIKIKNIETDIGNNTKLSIPNSSISLQQQMSENNENSCLLDEFVVKHEPVEYEPQAAMYEFKEVKDYLPLPKLKLISEMKRQTYKQQQTKNLELNLQNHLHNNNNNNITQKFENTSLLRRQLSSASPSPSSSTNTLASQSKKRNSCELPKKLECNENSNSNTATKSNNNDDNSSSTKLSRKKHSKRKDYLRAVKHLGKDLRKIQKNFIKDFFEQQNEILRKQHEFQRKQDQLFLEHFDAQTRDLVQTVKNILSSSTNTNTPIVYIDD